MTKKKEPLWDRCCRGNGPCPICQEPNSWCAVSPDGIKCRCRKIREGSYRTENDKNGVPYYLHLLNGQANDRQHDPSENGKSATVAPTGPPKPLASVDVRDRVYREILRVAPLDSAHRDVLKERGLTADEIKRGGYRTLESGDRKGLIQNLQARCAGVDLLTIPGIEECQSDKGAVSLRLRGWPGLLVPVRDIAGRIVALRVRFVNKQGEKEYNWISSAAANGPSPGAPPHVAQNKKAWNLPVEVVRVTEGEIKANQATNRTGILTLGIAGVAMWRNVLPILQDLGAKRVLLAWDADANTNREVATALRAAFDGVRAAGYQVEVETWNIADGKGIDDLLHAGKVPQVASGSAAEDTIRRIEATAWKADPPPEPSQAGNQQAEEQKRVREDINDPHRLARFYLQHRAAHPHRPRVAFYRQQWWWWEEAYWQRRPDAEMSAELTRFTKERLDLDAALIIATWAGEGSPPPVPKVTKGLITNVAQALAGDTLVCESTPQPSWLGGQRPGSWIALDNGILDVEKVLGGALETEILSPHSPLWFSPVCLPYEFDPAADCPAWLRFLARNLADKSMELLLQEWAGYCLLPDTSRQKMLLMTGEGNNGKSVICAAFTALLGAANLSHVPLELFGQRFRLYGTIGKLLNLMPETGEIDKTAEGLLKAFVVGDPIEVEQKHKQPFSVRPTARIMVATNNAPMFSDKTDGIWRRILLMPLTVQIPDNEQVAGMDKPEFWEAEAPGILNWAIVGLCNLRQQGRFTEPAGCREAKDRLRQESNPARLFLLEQYQEGKADDYPPKSDVYASYKEWCTQCGHHPLADNKFAREVMRTFKGVRGGKKVPKGALNTVRKPVWEGLAVRPLDTEEAKP